MSELAEATSLPAKPSYAEGRTRGNTVRNDTVFSDAMLNVGFATALALAATCLILSAAYLFQYLISANAAIEAFLSDPSIRQNPDDILGIGIAARMQMGQLAFRSCGVFVGMGFGFLGFALFLMGVKGEMDTDASSESIHVKVSRMSPGMMVIICATILVTVSITHTTSAEYKGPSKTTASPAEELDVPLPEPAMAEPSSEADSPTKKGVRSKK